jgi:hypothetical protein
VSSDEWVSASEVAAYTYCARAYWLERVTIVERPLRGESVLAAGRAHHIAHGRRVRVSRWMLWVGTILVLLGVLRLT